MFEEGVNWYETGTAHVKVFFPEGNKRCQYCKFICSEKELKRFICLLTDEIILHPFTTELGHKCPIAFEETPF